MLDTLISRSTRCLGALLLIGFTLETAARELPDFTSLAKAAAPAVVNIGTRSSGSDNGDNSLPGPENPLHEFFERFLEDAPVPRSSLGSGFIISADGYVVSNYHVIKDAEEVFVRLNDRREFDAEVVGYDESSDLAVLKIDASGLPAVKVGNSDELEVGSWVLAIGSPFGFDYSVTAGIVSAKGRSLPNENYVPFIQTDVAINPGNSGGPLFNLDGEVVGVNAQIFSQTGGFMGLSFAIPANVVQNVYYQIRETGSVTRGWLGVLIQDVTYELAESFSMSRPAGALVSKVLDDSPAAEGGIEAGDVIVTFNGVPIDKSADLPPVVGSTLVGSTVKVDAIRNSEPIKLQLTIGKLPESDEIELAVRNGSSGGSPDNRLQIAVRPLSDEIREEFSLDEEGVLVTRVGADGPAAKAGIESGDVILMLNNVKIAGVDSFKEAVEALPDGKSVPLLVQRRSGPMFLALRVPGRDPG